MAYGSTGKATKMNVAGHYIRTGRGDSAELRIVPSLSVGERFHVDGLALWGEKRPYGPNIGVLEFSADLEGNTLRHSEDEKQGHLIVLKFSGDTLQVTEENWVGIYGMNVNFEGTYRRATALSGMVRTWMMALRRLIWR